MVCVISALSLLGLLLVPFLQRNTRAGLLYKYLITLLISMGVSALVSAALLHLIPNVSVLRAVFVTHIMQVQETLLHIDYLIASYPGSPTCTQ